MPLVRQPICYCASCEIVHELARILGDHAGTDAVRQLEKRLVRGGFSRHDERTEWMAAHLAAAIFKHFKLYRVVNGLA